MRRWALALVNLAMALAIGRATPVVATGQLPAAAGAAIIEGISLDRMARIQGNDAWKAGARIYLESRAGEQAFDRAFRIKAYRYDSVCFFNCHVPWSFRSLPLSRWTAVTDPVARAFASLERELGWPALHGALREAVEAGGSDPIATMSAATGRDLKPVFEAVRVETDHAVATVTSSGVQCGQPPCYRTQVSMVRSGAVPFPLRVRVSFADGQEIETAWQGRSRLTFESPAAAVAVRLDPDRVWLLDTNPFNNARVAPQPTNVPVTKWLARWMMWLQDAMLAHTFPV